MNKFSNPLDNVRVAAPCRQNWDEMIGDDRKRFCGECKLNVYNLSGMTRDEAESLLINSEGRLCVRFYRRADGTVLTQDCPVGWRAVKKRISKTATAAFAMLAGIFGGVFSLAAFKTEKSHSVTGEIRVENSNVTTMGTISNDGFIQGNYSAPTPERENWTTGGLAVEPIMGKMKVDAKNKKRGR